ncbi:hypothetical protein E2C01_076964 [Portunus trituberculatus]|uniref:Uncharacterized protein n=1 Tax=Portunus trituberculatus TaxID=210409 RepID=A0A5B7IKG5_PORTR|nr:hypothetical protein [Portunus trituberculatus]
MGRSASHSSHRPSSAWATPSSVLICTVYVCLVTPSALSVGLPLRPWNISCSNAHAFTLTTPQYAHGSPPWSSENSTCPPSWRLQASTSPSNLLFFLRLTCAFLRKTGQLSRL